MLKCREAAKLALVGASVRSAQRGEVEIPEPTLCLRSLLGWLSVGKLEKHLVPGPHPARSPILASAE